MEMHYGSCNILDKILAHKRNITEAKTQACTIK
jgi:hypothetical protein